jgi:hypothetical protein
MVLASDTQTVKVDEGRSKPKKEAKDTCTSIKKTGGLSDGQTLMKS